MQQSNDQTRCGKWIVSYTPRLVKEILQDVNCYKQNRMYGGELFQEGVCIGENGM